MSSRTGLLTSEEVTKFASSLREAGVSRIVWGDLTIEFAPQFESVAQDEPGPVELSAMEKAAIRLTNRGRAA